MATNYQDLLDMLKPQEEEKLFSSIEPTSQQLISPINPTPEELAALSQQQAPAVEEIAEPVQAPVKNAAQPVLKKAPIEQSMESGDPGISKAMDALKNWENRPKEEASSITQTQATTTEAPMSKSEALIAEYNKLLGKGQEDLAEARRRDRMLKVGGSLGDALATYLNARSQMNVKAPGVQVQQGAGLGKIADMFATAPEIASDVAQRREAMMKQYAELAKGERSQARLTSEEKRAEKRMQQEEKLTKAQIDAKLKAAQIAASGKSEKTRELTPYQERQIERQERKEAKLSDKQTAELEGINNVLNSLDEVETAKAGVNTGRYVSAIQSGKEALPFSEADQDFVKLRQLSGTQLFDYVKNQSGVSYSVKELEQLKSNMPNVEDDDNTFMTKLKTVRGIVERKQKEKLSAFEKQGKNVSEFKQNQPAKKAAAGDIVTIKGKDYRVAEDGDTLIPVGKQ